MFRQIWALIQKHDSIVIFGHINPDGDCYGSQVGLKELILSNYPKKKVYLAGSGLPRFFNLISPMDEVGEEIISKSLAILVDGNDLDRMEDARCHNALAFAKIDHHIDTGSFTEGPFVVDVDANSTCDIIAGFVLDYHLKLSKLGANALYLGILTDSANFQFVNNYPETFDRAKNLCLLGAEPHTLLAQINKSSESSLLTKGYVLTHYKKTETGVIYSIYTKEELRKIHTSANFTSSLVNLLGNVEGYPIWCTFAEYEDGRVRCEFRSNGPIIQPIAVSIGGGGHAMACGASLAKLDYDLIESIIAKFDEAIKQWRNN